MKKSGVALLATIISIAVLLLVSGGFFTIMASNTGLIKSGGESLQAQYFAQLEADTIKMLSYDEVDNITQDTWQEFDIDNSWQYKVNVGPEQNVGDSDNTMKIASISVRKNGDTINRFALDVPLSSQGSNSNSNSFPDYSRRYLLAQNKEYIAETNGYVYIYWWDCPSHYRTGYLTIDGMKFVIGAAYGNNTNQHHKTVFFPISKGSSYLIDGNVYYQAIYFVPCK